MKTTKVKNKKENKTDWKYFDDCLICKAMEKADKRGRNLSMEELKSAFKEQNKKNNKT